MSKKIKHKINLKVAKQNDFLQLDKYLKGSKKKWKMIFGTPYWMCNSKGKIENKNYILSKDTDLEDFRMYLSRKQIFILK